MFCHMLPATVAASHSGADVRPKGAAARAVVPAGPSRRTSGALSCRSISYPQWKVMAPRRRARVASVPHPDQTRTRHCTCRRNPCRPPTSHAGAGARLGPVCQAAPASSSPVVDRTINPRVASLKESKTMALTDLARSMKEAGKPVRWGSGKSSSSPLCAGCRARVQRISAASVSEIHPTMRSRRVSSLSARFAPCLRVFRSSASPPASPTLTPRPRSWRRGESSIALLKLVCAACAWLAALLPALSLRAVFLCNFFFTTLRRRLLI